MNNADNEVPNPFGILLSEVRVRNFRGIEAVDLAVSPRLTVLVGENNCGKTSFLEAIAVALGRRRAQLSDLRRLGTETAKGSTIDLKLIPNGEEFSDIATEVFGDAVQGVATSPYVALRVRIDRNESRDDIGLSRCYLLGWSAEAAELSRPRPSEKALELLSFEMLDARRDVLEQLRNRSSLLGRALTASQFDASVRASVETQLKEISEVLRAGSPSLSKLREHLAGLRSTLPASVEKVEIDPLPHDLDDLVRAVDIRVEDAGGSFSAASLGMGTRALAALFVFRTFVDTARASKGSEHSMSMAAFEEPEAHLHPQAQRAIVKMIREMPGQVIVSTHSGEVASQADVSELRVFRRQSTSVRVFTTARPSDEAEAVQQRRFLLVRSAAVLFAKAVIIVEGESERALMTVFADAWWCEHGGCHGRGVEIVSVDGAGSAKHVSAALDGWKFIWSVVVDGDAEGLKALDAVNSNVGRKLAEEVFEVVVLRPKLEEYLVAQPGLREAIYAAGRKWPDQSIDDWAQLLHGQKYKGGGTRDYQATGFEDRVAVDWMAQHKGVCGEAVAREIASVKVDGKPRLPPAIRSLFESIDQRLVGAQ